MKSKKVIELSNYNVAREDTKISNLGEIQKLLIDLFFLQPNLTDDKLENFESSLYANPAVFSPNIDYSNVRGVDSYFNFKKQTLIQHQNVVLNSGRTM